MVAVGVPRAALFAVVPVELLILASILSGSLTPTPAAFRLYSKKAR